MADRRDSGLYLEGQGTADSPCIPLDDWQNFQILFLFNKFVHCQPLVLGICIWLVTLVLWLWLICLTQVSWLYFPLQCNCTVWELTICYYGGQLGHKLFMRCMAANGSHLHSIYNFTVCYFKLAMITLFFSIKR